MRLKDSIRDNLLWFVIPILIAIIAIVIALFVMGEFDPGSTDGDFVYPI